jgi:hypothetical protein
MARFFTPSLLMILMLVTSCATEKTDPGKTPVGRPVLTDAQVQRFLNSYLPVQAMASEYWGKRRYTPPGEMLPIQGTFERAISEMRAAGTLPDFELLLQSHGFESFESWKQTEERISFAYTTLHMESRNPARLMLKRQARTDQLAKISERQNKLKAQQDNRNRADLEALNRMQKEVERGMLADADAEVLRPYLPRFEQMNREAIRRER